MKKQILYLPENKFSLFHKGSDYFITPPKPLLIKHLQRICFKFFTIIFDSFFKIISIVHISTESNYVPILLQLFRVKLRLTCSDILYNYCAVIFQAAVFIRCVNTIRTRKTTSDLLPYALSSQVAVFQYFIIAGVPVYTGTGTSCFNIKQDFIMKKFKLISLSFLILGMGFAQTPHNSGITTYSNPAAVGNMRCSSGIPVVINTAGHIMSSYAPSLLGFNVFNFALTKTDDAGLMIGAAPSDFFAAFSFSRSTGASCSGSPLLATDCYGNSIIETVNSPNNYALATSFDRGILFTTHDNSGALSASNYFEYTGAGSNPSKALIIESSTVSDEYLIVGSVYLNAQTKRVLYVLRVDGSGNLLWSQTYDYGDALLPNDLCLEATGTGNLVIAGTCFLSSNSQLNDGFMAVINENTGSVVNFVVYNCINGITQKNDQFNSISRIISGGNIGYAIGGATNNGGTSFTSWILRVNSGGSIVWSSDYMGSITTSNDSIVSISSRYSTYNAWEHYGTMNSDQGILTIKIDDSGNSFSNGANTNNEFYYESDPSSATPDSPISIGYLDGINSTVDGVHVYGNDNQGTPSELVMINASFNGVAGGDLSSAIPCYGGIGVNYVRCLGALSSYFSSPATYASYPSINVTSGMTSCSNYGITSSFPSITLNNPCTYTANLQNSALQNKNSSILDLRKSIIKVNQINVFPTLLKPSESLTISGEFLGEFEVKLVNALGQVVNIWHKNQNEAKFGNEYYLPISQFQLVDGIYSISIKTIKSNYQFKILVNNN